METKVQTKRQQPRNIVEEWRQKKQAKQMRRWKRRDAKEAARQRAKKAKADTEQITQHGASAVMMGAALQFAATMRRLLPKSEAEKKPPRYDGPHAGARQLARQQRQYQRDRLNAAARRSAAD
jgi:hypothetical protein